MKYNFNNKIKEFNKKGYVVFENVIDLKDLKKIKSNFKKNFYGKYSTSIVPDKIKWKPGRDSLKIPRSLCNVWKSDLNIAKVVLSKSVSYLASKLMKWNSVRLNQDSIIWVVPNAGAVSFHQDNPYQDWHTPGKIITAWIPITDTGINSGGIEYLPYSHKKKGGKRLDKFFSSKDYRFPLKKKYGKNIVKKIEIIDIKVGSIVFHHGDIWHGSGFNQTKTDRIALSIHFMNGKSKFHPKIKNPQFNHYKLFDTLKMEESFFPITWSGDNKVSKFIKSYIK
jgi:ectoine hydroxylase-related dioxygenase (phytanoyl-CoA dioxygenase family)